MLYFFVYLEVKYGTLWVCAIYTTFSKLLVKFRKSYLPSLHRDKGTFFNVKSSACIIIMLKGYIVDKFHLFVEFKTLSNFRY